MHSPLFYKNDTPRASAWGEVRNLLFNLILLCLIHSSVANTHCQLQDSLHHTITLSQPAKRVMSLAPNLTEIVYAIGAGKTLVGVDSASDYPLAAKKIKQVASASGIDIERVLSLHPDLIFVWEQGSDPHAEMLLARHGIDFYHATFTQLQDISKVMRDAGCLTGHRISANRKANNLEKALQQIKQDYQQYPAQRVAFQIWPQPLMLVGGKGFIAESLTTCHANNVFASVNKAVFTADVEQILSADPAWLIVNNKSALSQWQHWQRLHAVKHHQIIVINPDYLERPSPRIVLGIKQLCQQLHH